MKEARWKLTRSRSVTLGCLADAGAFDVVVSGH